MIHQKWPKIEISETKVENNPPLEVLDVFVEKKDQEEKLIYSKQSVDDNKNAIEHKEQLIENIQ